MRKSPIVRATFTGLAAIALLATSAGTASAESIDRDELKRTDAEKTTHCVVTVDRADPKSPEAKIVSHACTDNPAETPTITPAASYDIVTFYEDANYEGDSVTVEGDDGPCDAVGYEFSDLRGIHEFLGLGGISSFVLESDGGCNQGRYYNDTDFQGDYAWHDRFVPYLPAGFNDTLHSMQTWRNPGA